MKFDSITPDFAPHLDLEQSVTDYLQSLGFLCSSLTYHDSLPETIVCLLKSRYSPTSLYLRGRADRIAIHTKLPIEFEYELKTHASKIQNDLTLEALPLIHHISKGKLGVKCLYIYRNPSKWIERGFWVHDLPTIDSFYIPNRWNPIQTSWYESIVTVSLYPRNIKIIKGVYVGGSGDPFFVIKEIEVAKLHPWQNLIADSMKELNSNNGIVN